MSALREMFKYAMIISGNNILISILNFVTFLVMLNALGTYGFGLFTLAMSVLSIATFIIELGFGKAIVSDVSKALHEKNEEHASGLFSGYVIFVLVSMVVLAVTMFFFSDYVSAYFFGKDFSPIIKFTAILVLLSGIKTVITSSFHIVADFNKYASFLFLDALSKLALVWIFVSMFSGTFVSFFGGTLEAILGAFILSGAITTIIFALFIPKEICNILKLSRKSLLTFSEMLKKHGKWVAIHSQLRSVESNISPWIVEFFLGVNAVGVYGALLKVQVLILRVFEPLETIFYPLVSRFSSFDDSRKMIYRATKYILFISIPLIIIGMIFSELLLDLILGKGFAQYANVFRIMLLMTILFILNIPMKPLFFNLKAQKSLALISVVLLASTLVIGSILTFYFGLIGMALNNVFTPLIDVVLKNRFMKKISGEKYSLKEMLFFDRADFDLIKKILSNPKFVLTLFKGDSK